MTLQELYQALQSSRVNDDVVITYQTAESAYWMLLAAAEINELIICQAQIVQKENRIEITGKGIFASLSNIGETVFLLSSSVNEYGTVFYKLTLTVKGEGSFCEFFGKLPQSLVFEEKQEYRECIYADFILSYPIITIDSEQLFEPFPFWLTGIVKPLKNGLWEKYAYLLDSMLSIEGGFSLKKRQLKNQSTIIDFNIRLTEIVQLPLGNASLKLRLVSVEQESVFGREPYLSKAYLVFGITVENLSENMEFFAELFTGSFFLSMGASFPKGLSIGNIVKFFGSLFQVEEEALLLPQDTVLTAFGLKELQMDLSQQGNALTDGISLEHIRVTCGLSEAWKLPVPFVTLGTLMTAWEVSWFGRKTPIISLYAATELSFTLGSLQFRLAVSGYIPQMRFYGALEVRKQPTLQSMMDTFGAVAPVEWGAEEKLLASASIMISVPERLFSIEAHVNDILSIYIGNEEISLEEIVADVEIGPSGQHFHIDGVIGFGNRGEEDYFAFLLGADYKEGWLFQGALRTGEVNIGKLLEKMFRVNVFSDVLFQVVLDGFEVEYNTSTGGFSLMASFYTSWFTVLGITPKLGGRILLKKEKKEQAQLYGAALAYLDIEIFRILVQVNDFYAENPSYLFRLEFQKLYLQAVYEKKSEDEILTITMGGITLGGLIEELVQLLNPNAKFSLPSPWEVLKKIELSRFSLVLNTTRKTATFLYQVDLNIPGLMEIRKVGIKYGKKGEKGCIDIVLTGRLLNLEYTEDEPLSWDILDEKPPQNTAVGETKLEIYYVGLGQHLDIGSVIASDSIIEALDLLKQQITGTEAGELPDVGYSEETNWLFGVDFKISDMFRFGMVLNDPALYGAAILVEASEQSPLAVFNGLFFELLYKKISDEVGMFRITFMMPECFRKLQLGIICVTLGQILVEIYTNGSFLVDFGFPHQGDFSKSFGLEFYVFTGKGGIYFGALKQDAVKSVPKITNGAFSPVILLGIGLRVGLGRSFDFGIVKAGLSLELLGIFEGVLGFFKPDERSQKETPAVKEALYYCVKAKAGVVGTLFLSADLKIVFLSVSAQIEAWCELVLESYRQAKIELALSLKLAAKIKILFFKINFSFSFQQNVEFTLGSNEETPWVLEEQTENVRRKRLEIKKLLGITLEKEMFPAEHIGDWNICVSIMPLLSVTNPMIGILGAQSLEYCAAFLGVISSGEFCSVLDMLVCWVFAAWEQELIWREDILSLDGKVEQKVDYHTICSFFEKNIHLQITLQTTGSSEENAILEEGGVFPMLPQLVLSMNEEETDYGTNMVSEAYVQALHAYFEEIQPKTVSKQRKQKEQFLEGEIPFCGVILADWIQMVLSEILRRLRNQFYSFTIQESDIVSAAARYDVTVKEILENNASLQVQIQQLPEYTYLLQAEDSLCSLTERFDIPAYTLWKMVSAQAGILQNGVLFSTKSNVFENSQNGLTVAEAAAYFFVRYYEYEVEGKSVSYADRIVERNPMLSGEWECMASGKERIILPERGEWSCLPGDTVNRLAKFLSLLKEGEESVGSKVGLWREFRQRFFANNGNREGAVLARYKIEADAIVDGDITLPSLFRRIYCDDFLEENEESRLKNTELWCQNILSSMTAVRLSQVKLEVEDTVGGILGKGICSLEELAGAFHSGEAAVKQGQTIVISSAGCISKQELTAYLTAKESAAEILSVVSRFFLQGLRVPIPESITENGFKRDCEMVPLYQLLGQQKVLADITKDITLSIWKNDVECQWLLVEEAKKVLEARTIQEVLPSGSIMLLEKPQRKADFVKTAKCWNILQLLDLQEYAGEQIFYRSIGLLPSDLQCYLESCQEKPVLKVNQIETEAFFWGSLIEIGVKKGSEEGVYYVYGADADKRQLLRQMIDEPISALRVVYRPSELESDAQSYITADFSERSVLVKTNLSRETHRKPVYNTRDQDYQYSACLNECHKFLRLLWECSVIGGGYYLKLKGATLPEGIWDEDCRGKLYIIALFADAKAAKQGINCILTQKRAEKADVYSRELLVDVPLLPPGYAGLELEMTSYEEEDSLQGRMDDLYQIVGYRIRGGEVAASGESVPITPLEGKSEEVKYYPIAIPLYRFAGDGSLVYGAVGKQAEVMIEIRDVLGNQAEWMSEVVMGTYNDMVIGLNQIPSTSLSFAVIKGQKGAQLEVWISYVEQAEISQEGIVLLERMRQQLACEDMCITVSCSFQEEDWEIDRSQYGELQNYLRELSEYLVEERKPENVPKPVAMYMTLDREKLPVEIVPLSVQMCIRRTNTSLIESGVEEAEFVFCEIPPALGATKIEDESFILEFEAVLGGLRLAQCDKGWYCVPVGKGFIQRITVCPYTRQSDEKTIKSPEYYSYMPLSTALISRKLVLPDREGREAQYSYREIDLDIWMKRFLQELEEIFLVDGTACIAAELCADVLDEFVRLKEELAQKLSDRIQPLREQIWVSSLQKQPDNEVGNAADFVRRIAADRMKRSLKTAYEMDVIAVYDAVFATSSYCRMEMDICCSSGDVISPSKLSSEEQAVCLFINNRNQKRASQIELTASLSNLEYRIEQEENGYESSEWLKLVHPLTSQDGNISLDFSSDVKVPNPIKECPMQPVILSHQSKEAAFLRWSYQLVCQCRCLEQNSIYLKIRFARELLPLRKEERDLFYALAAYDVQRDSIQADLTRGGEFFVKAYQDMKELVNEVEELFPVGNQSLAATDFATCEDTLLLKIEFLLGEKLQFQIEPIGGSRELLQELGASLGEISLVAGGVEGEMMQFSLEIKNLPIYRCQCAKSSIWLVQNENLFADSGEKVRDGFIYRTEEMFFTEFRVFQNYRKDISQEGQIRSIAEVVADLWEYMEFNHTLITADIAVWYKHYLRADETQGIRVPVTFIPNAVNASIMKETAIAQTVENIRQWYQEMELEASLGSIQFEVTVYSQRDGQTLLTALCSTGAVRS